MRLGSGRRRPQAGPGRTAGQVTGLTKAGLEGGFGTVRMAPDRFQGAPGACGGGLAERRPRAAASSSKGRDALGLVARPSATVPRQQGRPGPPAGFAARSSREPSGGCSAAAIPWSSLGQGEQPGRSRPRSCSPRCRQAPMDGGLAGVGRAGSRAPRAASGRAATAWTKGVRQFCGRCPGRARRPARHGRWRRPTRPAGTRSRPGSQAESAQGSGAPRGGRRPGGAQAPVGARQVIGPSAGDDGQSTRPAHRIHGAPTAGPNGRGVGQGGGQR